MTTGEIAANPGRRRFEFTACGPTGKLSREALVDVLLVYAGAIGVRILVTLWGRAQARPDIDPSTGPLLLAGAIVAGGLVALLFRRMLRRGDRWAVFLGGLVAFAAFFRFDSPPLAAGTALERPLLLLPLVLAALAIWAFVAMVRETDELERRIFYQALAFGSAFTFAATLAYSILEDFGLPQISSFWWWMVLAVSWSVGLSISARKYR